MPVTKIVIGRRDRIDLPDLGFFDIRAKVDTGAYGCALHCSKIRVTHGDGTDTLHFTMLDPEHPGYNGEEHTFTEFTDKVVRSSSGETEHRYTIETTVVFMGKLIPTHFSLTNRSEMKYPVLLGREFLSKRFVVDVNKKDISFKQKRAKNS